LDINLGKGFNECLKTLRNSAFYLIFCNTYFNSSSNVQNYPFSRKLEEILKYCHWSKDSKRWSFFLDWQQAIVRLKLCADISNSTVKTVNLFNCKFL